MGKADRARANRKAKQARRDVRRDQARVVGVDLSAEAPSDEVFDSSACPLEGRCAGCGTTTGLRVMISYFGPGEAACATVCGACDGKSMLHLAGVGLGGIGERVTAHAAHRP